MAVMEAGQDLTVGVAVEDLYSAFVHAPTGIAVLTPTGVVTGGNPALAMILGREVTDLVGGTLFAYTHPDDLPTALASCSAMAAGSVMVVRWDCRFLRPDATTVWVRVSTSRVETRGDRAAHLIMHVEDISEQKALEARLLRQALHDPLTGLGNRALLHQRVTDELCLERTPRDDETSPAHGQGSVCGLVLLDLDGFKALNDAFGHPTGDAALIEVARRVQALLGPADLAVRLGGDEFAVWCPGTTPATVVRLVERLRAAVGAPCRVEGALVQLTASIGSATHTMPDGPQVSDPASGIVTDALAGLLRAADTAMYVDKRRAGVPPS